MDINQTDLTESIYSIHYEKIQQFLEKNLIDKSILEDATQEIFKEFLESLSKEQIALSLEHDYMMQYILHHLANKLCITIKKKKKEKSMSSSNKKKDLKEIHKTIQKELNERYRDVLILRYIKHYKADDIIDILHINSKEAYNKLLQRAKSQLAKLILAIILLVTVSTTTTYAIKKIYIKFKENPFDNKKQISFVVPNATPEPTEFEEFTDEEFIPHMPAYIPKSYKLSDKMSTSTSHLVTYTSDDDTITYVQMPFSSAVSIDNNLKIVSETTKNDITYYYMTRDDTQLATIHMLTWSDGNYQYQITSQKLKEKELVKIAESIQIEK